MSVQEMTNFKEKLKSFVIDNPKLVMLKPIENNLFILKYKKVVFLKSLWNEFLEECRGAIVDSDFNVISRPFTKIYNFRVEDKSPVLSDETPVTAYRKVNGFMVALTWYNGDILVSTTGSVDSDFVTMAKEMMLKHQSWAEWQIELLSAKHHTLLFECVHPSDPHICPEKPGMYFLGLRSNSWDSSIIAYGAEMIGWAKDYATDHLKCYCATGFMTTVGELMVWSKTVKHEGFVFYTADGQSAKIKSKYYLVQKALARKKDIMSLNKALVDEEYYELIEHLSAMKDEFNSMPEQDRLDYMRNFLETN